VSQVGTTIRLVSQAEKPVFRPDFGPSLGPKSQVRQPARVYNYDNFWKARKTGLTIAFSRRWAKTGQTPPGHPGYDTPGGPRTYSPGGPRSHSGGRTRNHIPGYPGANLGGRPRGDSPGRPRSYLGGCPRGLSGGSPQGYLLAALGGPRFLSHTTGLPSSFVLRNWWLYRSAIIVIGAGIAGLSAGRYAQMNGYRSRIFDRGDGRLQKPAAPGRCPSSVSGDVPGRVPADDNRLVAQQGSRLPGPRGAAVLTAFHLIRTAGSRFREPAVRGERRFSAITCRCSRGSSATWAREHPGRAGLPDSP
jgi:hypothetical protein